MTSSAEHTRRAGGPAPGTSAELLPVLLANRARFEAFLRRRLGSAEDAEDLLQNAFLKGMEKAVSIRDDESAVAWFYRLLRNALVDHYRRRAAERRALERVAAETPTEEDVAAAAALDQDAMETACACIADLAATLKPEYAQALRRVDLDGVAVRDFAAEAGITPDNASVRLHRARRALRTRVMQTCQVCATHGCVDCRCNHSADSC